MRNTGITYSSAERTPVVLPEMAELLPPLSEEQRAALEKDILQNGCYSPVIVNEDMVVVDGHNRLDMCQKHGLPFQMLVFAFENLLEAKKWALDTQKGRRNLTVWELGKIMLKLKPDVEAKALANQSEYHGNQHDGGGLWTDSSKVHNEQVDTRKELADSVGIGRTTANQIIAIDERAPDAVKEALDNKAISVNKGYNITREVEKLPEEEREQAAKNLLNEKLQSAVQELDAESTRRKRVAQGICTAFEKSILVKPTEENIRIWTEYTRMTPGEMCDKVEEAHEIADKFNQIADTLQNTIIPSDWRCVDGNSEGSED